MKKYKCKYCNVEMRYVEIERGDGSGRSFPTVRCPKCGDIRGLVYVEDSDGFISSRYIEKELDED